MTTITQGGWRRLEILEEAVTALRIELGLVTCSRYSGSPPRSQEMSAAEIRQAIASARFEDLIEAFRPEHDFQGSLWACRSVDGETRFPCTNCQVEGGNVLRNTGARNPYYAVAVNHLSFRCDYCQHVGTRFEVEEVVLNSYSLLEKFLVLLEYRQQNG
jgi:hypothetical protein